MLNVDQMQAINDWLEHIESDDRRRQGTVLPRVKYAQTGL
jgi:hypothetical protein